MSETLAECIKRIHVEGDVCSTVLFGSSVRKREEFERMLSLTESDSSTRFPLLAELDLLLVVKEKSLGLLDLLKRCLAPYGYALFHPSFYEVRSTHRPTFEIIALPKHSSWFARNNLGRLVGLSVLRAPNFVHFAGSPVADCIEMPSGARTRDERLPIALHGHAGLLDMCSKLWAALGNGDRVDPFRVAKWLICDTVWVESGTFYSELDILADKFATFFPDLSRKHSGLVRGLAAMRTGEAGDLREDYELARELVSTLKRAIPEDKSTKNGGREYPESAQTDSTRHKRFSSSSPIFSSY
jgi:hypothetical protein